MEDKSHASRVIMGVGAVMISALVATTFVVVGQDVLSDDKRFAEALHDFLWGAFGLFAVVGTLFVLAEMGRRPAISGGQTVQITAKAPGLSRGRELELAQARVLGD